MFALNRKGIPISLPYGDNQRYDLIIDHNNKLSKVQIKTCLKDKDDQNQTFLMIIIKNDLGYNCSNALVPFRIKN